MVRGKVMDFSYIPLPNAHISNISSGSHAHTDGEGLFLLKNTSLGDTLRITHLSYEPASLIVASLDDLIFVQLEESIISLDHLVITPSINALNLVSEIDLKTSSVNSSQDILRKVPGLFIGQHAGGGKAEQIFLRGFDIDHGTDITIDVDGLPVNMVSHAHGQGYADLHFVIPETVEKIDFGKGPYYADKGNFNTAGYVSFATKKSLDKCSIKLESGLFNTYRMLGMLNVLDSKNNKAYLALEHMASNGPFESPQNFRRFNVFGKFSSQLSPSDAIGITVSHFSSTWDASGQVPQRAVDQGLITRFGAIDDTEGGTTGRSNFSMQYSKSLGNNNFIKNTLFYTLYDFELFSNFTFFLEDPINGDQIKQKEKRKILGLNSEYNQSFVFGEMDALLRIGLQLRNDFSSDNQLSNTLNRREILNFIQKGNINETNLGVFANVDLNYGKWTFNPSIRFDHFDFIYEDDLAPAFDKSSESKSILSPKLNVLYNHNTSLQFYIKTGKGFHSNDTRVVVAQKGKQILPAAYGGDLGFIWKPLSSLFINAASWILYSEQEFVYVGDAGIVEPSGKSRRYGFDLGLRYQPKPWVFFNFDMNYTLARAIEEEIGQQYIPLAPDMTMVGSLKLKHPSGFTFGTDLRYIKDRPANEDFSIVAKGYTIVDANVGYLWKDLNFGLHIQNLLDTDWNETQFATESRLQNESDSVEEIHFTPGTPFFIKGSISYAF